MKKTIIMLGLVSAMAISVQAQGTTQLLFDFGSPTIQTPGNWNNVSTNTVGVQIANAVNSTGGLSGVSLRITDAFHPSYTPGTSGVAANNLYPTTAQQDYFTGNFDDPGAIRLEGLNTNLTYNFTFFGSRTSSTTDRIGYYTIGATTVQLNANTNTDRTVSITNVAPDASGYVSIGVSSSGTGSHYGYLGVLDVVWTNAPSGPQPLRATTFVIE